MSPHFRLSSIRAGLFAFAVLNLSLLSGCGVGTVAVGRDVDGPSSGTMGGILHGGPTPIIGATVSLYVTSSAGYGAAAAANPVATTTTDSNGLFNLTLPTTSVACPAGEFAYIAAYQGNTGGNSNNAASLLMSPIGACSTNYSSSNTGSVYTNTYLGQNLWIDELTTAVSAYALSGFMAVNDSGAISVGAPAANHATVGAASSPSAAGLAHAFANALALINNHTGAPNGYTHGGTSLTTGGVVPVAEIYLIGNILQACVNSSGVVGTNTSTANDGSACGKLFSLVTPPQSGAAVPTNTLEAMLDLAKYPNPAVNTWNTTCTAAGSGGTATATSCLFNLAPAQGAYTGALTAAPTDWALAVVYTTGYGAQTSGCTGTCPGFVYPYYVALDNSDNVYVLNYSASATTYTNIIGLGYDGTPLFSTAEDTTNKAIATIGTDTAGHVFGVNTNATSGSSLLLVYNSTSGANVFTSAATGNGTGANSGPVLADPLNNIYIASLQASIGIRKATYTAGPSYTIASLTDAPSAAVGQMTFGTNLDLYLIASPVSSVSVFEVPNTGTYTKGTAAAPTYSTTGIISTTITGTTSNAYGIGGNSSGGAFAIDSVGITPITKSGATIVAGTPTAIPGVYNSTLYSRGLIVDGLNTAYSVDGANGSATSGVSVYDSVDNLALGTYKGCYVIGKVCGTTSAGQVPMYSPRGAAIDSAGDIWVVSGASANLTELIGAAAPTWPGRSMGLQGEPQ